MQAYEQLRTTGNITINQDAPGTDVAVRGFGCVSIPKWAVVAYAWRLIVSGGVTMIVGEFANFSIIGIPAGTVMNALGIVEGTTGNALLYWADHTDWPKNICI